MNSAEAPRRVVERFLAEAITAGDSSAMDELVAEEALKQGVAWIKEAFPDHSVIPEKLLAAEDDHVVAVLRASGTHLGPLRDVRFDGQSMTDRPGRSAAVLKTIPPTWQTMGGLHDRALQSRGWTNYGSLAGVGLAFHP